VTFQRKTHFIFHRRNGGVELPHSGCIKAGVGKHLAATRCRSVKKLLPGLAEGQIVPKMTATTDIRNTMRVPFIIPTGRSILVLQSKPRSLPESVPWWLTSCNKFACAKHSLFYWGPVCNIMPGWNRSTLRKRLPTPALRHVYTSNKYRKISSVLEIWNFLQLSRQRQNNFNEWHLYVSSTESLLYIRKSMCFSKSSP